MRDEQPGKHYIYIDGSGTNSFKKRRVYSLGSLRTPSRSQIKMVSDQKSCGWDHCCAQCKSGVVVLREYYR